MKKKFRNPPTDLQRLVWERCWQNYGSLAGIVTRINQIGRANSTNLDEKFKLMKANDILKEVLCEWKDNYKIAKEKLKDKH